jgi:triosephosphate isomerase
MYGFSIAEKISIIYGGSVNVKNAKEFFQMENINGVLIGGASLDADKFLKIANCAQK